ncbi:MAG: type I methionyl aminopeptidase [Planctomycetota bacterium]|jgi:methionyl aminopeptidase
MWQTRSPKPVRPKGRPEIKGDDELDCMRVAGAIVGECLGIAQRMVAPGVTTGEIDAAVEAHIRSRDAEPAFKGYHGFPGSICASVNEEVVHGIPGNRVLKEGDIIGVDIGSIYKGYHGDAARTFAVGQISAEAQTLLDVTKRSLYAALDLVAPGVMISQLSAAVQAVAEEAGYGIVRQYVGHGIGRRLHEDPQIPNFVPPGGPEADLALREGMVIAIEPMLNIGTEEVETLADRWTVVTRDRSLSAHFENTIAVTEDGGEIFTEVRES